MSGDNSTTKFTIMHMKGEDGEHDVFSRPDGMIIGASSNQLAQWGEEVNHVEQHAFTTHEKAVAWLKGKCKEYAGRSDVDFLLEDGNPQILVARPGTLPRRRM